ncbi:MAG: prepilin-type N-terminal cleavage/methylation domain-containing protein, partial [Gammaproteobacteria bacterium]|nr:prepilin-type N-terminal cleavage/methylation domain-containing protein [Gammaproteobacteria bacterium]
MTYRSKIHSRKTPQRGFSLVELLVAMVLSLILIAATAQSYVSSKATYRNTTQVSELQGNVRFSSYFLSTEIKKTGNMGCFQDVTSVLQDNAGNLGLFDFSVPVQVWSFQGTEENTNYVIGSDTPVAAGVGRGQWRNKDNVRLPAKLRDRIVPGTDLIVFTSVGENLPVALEDGNKVADLDLEVNGRHTADRGQLILVGDCQYADIFQHTTNSKIRFSLDGNVNPGNNTFNSGWSRPWNSAHEVRAINHFAYYIG